MVYIFIILRVLVHFLIFIFFINFWGGEGGWFPFFSGVLRAFWLFRYVRGSPGATVFRPPVFLEILHAVSILG